MLAPAAESPPPYRSSLEVRSISSSPERARALPESIRGSAAGFREYSCVVVVCWVRRRCCCCC